MVSSLPGSPRRANTPTSSKATRRISISTHRRHSFSGAGLEEALTKELTNLVRCTPRNTTVTLVVELNPGDETPSPSGSGESDDKTEGSSSDGSQNSIVELDCTSEDSLQSEPFNSNDAVVRSSPIAEVEQAAWTNRDPSLTPNLAALPAKASSAHPTIHYNPYLANTYSMASPYAAYPPSAQDPYYDYQLGSAYHTRFPSYATTSDSDYLPMSPPSFLPTSPLYSTVAPYSVPSADYLPPVAGSHSQAPLPWTQHQYSPDCTPDSMASYMHQQLYYNPSATTGMRTPPSPPDLLYPAHFPRRPSHDSSIDSHGVSSFSPVAWDRQELYPGIASPGNSVLEQLERGEVLRRSGVTKFFDMQKGFGFIVDDAIAEIGGRDIFVHYTAILMKQGFRCLNTDERVEYDLVKASSGGFQALNVSGPRGRSLKGISDAPRSQPTSSEQREHRPLTARRKSQYRVLPTETFVGQPQIHSQSQATLPFPLPPSYKGSIGSPLGAIVSLPTPSASRAGSGTTTPQLNRKGGNQQKGGA